MSRACATFATDTYTEDADRSLWVCTALPATSTAAEHIEQIMDLPPGVLSHALGSRLPMENAMKKALTAGGGYPVEEGEALLNALNWSEGLPGLQKARPSLLKLRAC